jgi:hypothetical protein
MAPSVSPVRAIEESPYSSQNSHEKIGEALSSAERVCGIVTYDFGIAVICGDESDIRSKLSRWCPVKC